MILPPWSLWLRVDSPERRGTRVWLPLFILWLLLLPLALFALALSIVADVLLFLAGRSYHRYTLLLFGCLGLLADTRGMAIRVHNNDSFVDVLIH